MSERIVAAAVKVGDLIISVPEPERHHNVLHAMTGLGVEAVQSYAQGFLTSEGQFVNRRAALIIARKAGQIKKPEVPPG